MKNPIDELLLFWFAFFGVFTMFLIMIFLGILSIQFIIEIHERT